MTVALCAEGYRLYVAAYGSQVIVEGNAYLAAKPNERTVMMQEAREQSGLVAWRNYRAHMDGCPICKEAWRKSVDERINA